MSSVGWDAGNFIAIQALAIKVYTVNHAATNDHRISEEVAALRILIDKAAQHFNGTTISSDDRHDGQKILHRCQKCFGEFTFSY